MPLPALVCDCAIAGGGPTGSVLAARLARLGHRVVVFAADQPRGLPEETLLAGSERAFAALGLEHVLAACARPDLLRQGSIWGRDDVLWRQAGDAPGLRLARPALDAALRAHAQACGAQVIEHHTVRGPLPSDGQPVTVLRGGEPACAASARVWVVAAGRTFPRSLVRRRVVATAPETAAFTWRTRPDAAFAAANVVEAVAQGWLWWLPLADGSACATLFADAVEARRVGRARLLQAAIAQARGPCRRLGGTPALSATRATARVQEALADVFLAGDAAAALDPLASQGIEKALAAGDAAAVAVHTALVRPALRARARAHHAAWERGLFAAHARVTADFYRREERFAGEPFWRARRTPAPPAPALPSPAGLPGAVLPPLLRVAPALRAARTLRARGDLLEDEPGFALGPEQDAVTHVGRVPLAPLIAAFATPRRIEEGVGLAARDPAVFVLAPALVHAAVAEACARGYLVSGSEDARAR